MCVRSLLLAVFVLAGSLCCGTAAETNVSRKPPRLYRKVLSRLVTELNVPKVRPQCVADADSGVVLIDEDLAFVVEEGFFRKRLRRYDVTHCAYQALNESGVSSISELHYGFDSDKTEIVLAMARTVQPDGTVHELADDAVFLKHTKQGAGFYTDRSDLVMVFPNVKPKTVVEYIVVRKREELLLADEFSGATSLYRAWPIVSFRKVLQLPEKLGERLKVTKIGAGMPDAVKTRQGDAIRWEWTTSQVESWDYERNRAPASQFGPAAWYSTLHSWDQLAGWYSGLMAGRDQLNAALMLKVDEWTKDCESDDEVLHVLSRKVSDDVRYVGLEFGIAGYQPHDCNEVWQNRYGDCKDKSSLLCAMLRYKGFDAHVALVETSSVGRIIKEAPSHQQFNHAIAAIKRGDDWTFCDPTVRYMPAGVLGTGTVDREVFVIRDGKGEFVRTPAMSAGNLMYACKAKLNAKGGVSGWVRIELTGYYAASFRDYVEGIDRQLLKERMRGRTAVFFDNTRVVDVELPKAHQPSSFWVKIYFLVPDSHNSAQQELNLRFPGAGFIHRLDQDEARETPLTQSISSTLISADITLPIGWSATQLPRDFSVDTPAVMYKGFWRSGNGTLKPTFLAEQKERVIPIDRYHELRAPVESALAWTSNRVIVAPGEGGPAVPLPTETVEMEMMPSARGQIDLVDEKFPDDGNVELRRQALLKVKQWFPKDPNLFEVDTYLAGLEESLEKQETAYRAVLASYPKSEVSVSIYSWCEYMLAVTLLDAKKPAEAQKILRRLAEDPANSDFRRGWSYYQLGLSLSQAAPDEAIAAFQAALGVDGDALPHNAQELITLLVDQGDHEALKAGIADIVKIPSIASPSITHLIQVVKEKIKETDDDQHKALLAIARDIIAANPSLAGLKQQLDEAEDVVESLRAYQQVQSRLKAFLDKAKPVWYTEESVDPKLKTADEILEASDVAYDDSTIAQYLRIEVEYLLRFVDPDKFGEHLWYLTNNAVVAYPDAAWCGDLLAVCKSLPEDDDFRVEAMFTEAWHNRSLGQWAKSIKIYRALMDKKAYPRFYLPAHLDAADTWIEARQYEQALKLYDKIRAETGDNRLVNGRLRAVFVCLHLKKYEDALGWIKLLKKASDAAVKSSDSPEQIRAFIDLARTPKKALNFWKSHELWWPAWEELEETIPLDADDPDVEIPIYKSLSAFSTEYINAIEKKNDTVACSHLNVLVHSGRWLPSLRRLIPNLMVDMRKYRPSLHQTLTEFAIKSLHGWIGLTDEKEKQRLVGLAGMAYDFGDDEKTLATIRHYLSTFPGVKDSSDTFISRLHLLLAARLPEVQEDAIRRAPAAFKVPISQTLRFQLVYALAQVHRLRKEFDAELKVLKEAAVDPQIRQKQEFHDWVTQRLEELQQKDKASETFTKAVWKWLAAQELPWFYQTEPKNLKDLDFADLEAIAKGNSRLYFSCERFKAQMLIAMDKDQPLELKQTAFKNGFDFLRGNTQSPAEYLKLVVSMLDSGLPADEELELFQLELSRVAQLGLRPEFKALQQRDEYRLLGKQQQENLEEAIHIGVLMREGNADKLFAELEKQLSKDYSYMRVLLLDHCCRVLLLRGEFDKASELHARSRRAWRHNHERNGVIMSEIEYLRTSCIAKRELPAIRVLQKWILRDHPKPVNISDRLWYKITVPQSGVLLTTDEKIQIRLHAIQTEQASLADHIRCLEYVGNSLENVAALTRAQEAVTYDATRADIIRMIPDVGDYDQPEQKAAMLKALDTVDDPIRLPISWSAAQTVRALIDMREGKNVNFEAILKDIAVDDDIILRPAMLRFLVAQRDKAALNNVLDSHPMRSLFKFSGFTGLMAARICGRKEEETLYRKFAENTFQRSMSSEWLKPRDPVSIIELSQLLYGEVKYPDAWYKDVLSKTKDEYVRARLIIRDAYLRKDWKRVLEGCKAYLEQAPNRYSEYFYRGVAHMKLGDKEQAIKDLELVVKYCHNELEYPQATEMLEKLKAE